MNHSHKEPLYRKVNTRARNVHHHSGSDAKYDRHTKHGMSTKMKHGIHRGLDYTPLYRFLISKVGQPFDRVYSEAVHRLDKPDAIYHIILDKDNLGDIMMRYGSEKGYVKCGEGSYYSQLFVDENGILQFVNPQLKNEDLKPSCGCCTHTFNGKVLINKYRFDQWQTKN